jgi:signal peptidase I
MPGEPPPDANGPASGGRAGPSWWSRRRVTVRDDSMQPTLAPGDRLWVDVRAYRERPPRVGELVVIVDPAERTRWLVKRVAAVGPGTWWLTSHGLVRSEGSTVSTEGARPAGAVEQFTLGPTEIWVVGDAAERSRDSRRFGPVAWASLVGRVYACYAPPGRRRSF